MVDGSRNIGVTIHRLYTTPQYVPIAINEFHNVEIDIRDDTGNDVPFEFRKAVATLHYIDLAGTSTF